MKQNMRSRNLPARVGGSCDVLLLLGEVIEWVRLSKPTIYRRMAEGGFPNPVRLSKSRVAWKSSEIEAWIESLPVAGGFKNER